MASKPVRSVDLFLAQRRMDDGMFWEQNEDSLELISDMLGRIVSEWIGSESDDVSGYVVSTVNNALAELLKRRRAALRAFHEANKASEMKELVYINPMACSEHRNDVLVTLTEEKEEAKNCLLYTSPSPRDS